MLTLSISLIILFSLMIIGVPLVFSFGFSAFALKALGVRAASVLTAFTTINTFALTAVPLFIFMGFLMTASGASKRLIDFANVLVGGVAKGALGVAAVLGGVFFGACSGSSIAAVASLLTILQPKMTELGWPKHYTTALMGCVGCLGQLVPPSITLIVFGIAAQLPIGALFIGELIPGIIIAFLMSIVNLYRARKFPIVAPPKFTAGRLSWFKMAAKSGYRAFLIAMLAVFIAGGIYSGTFSPSEAGGLGATYVILIGFLAYRSLTVRSLYETSIEAAQAVGSVLILLMFNMMLVKVLIVAQIPQQITQLLVTHVANYYAILLILNVFLIFIGMLVDDVNAALLAASLFLPIIKTLGVNPIHFGAILAVNLGLGALTPPVCANLLMASRITKIPLMDFFGDVVPFIIFAFIPTLFLVTYIPSISLTLPSLLGMLPKG